MFISKIELTNFKSYQRAEFAFPEPVDGKNIVLIGGMNGYGKTTILEGLYLCLYGKESLPYLARAGVKTDDVKGYPTFLEKALNGEAKRNEADKMMSVRVAINRTKTSGLEITRRWYFRKNGSWLDEETVVREFRRSKFEPPRKDLERNFSLREVLEEQYVPAHVAPFFFFDGEEVKKLADQSRIEQVKQGLEGLLGVVLLRNLSERLKAFEDAKRSRLTNVDDKNIDVLRERLDHEERKLAQATGLLERHRDELEFLKAERQSLVERIVAAGGGGGEIGSVKDLAEERQQVSTQKKAIEEKLSRIVGDKLPFYLMPNKLLQEFRGQVGRELALSKWQAECRALQPKQKKFFNQILSDETAIFEPDLTEEQRMVLERRVEAAWQSLFLPPPANCADEILHSYLHEDLKLKAVRFLAALDVGRKEVKELIDDKNDCQLRIDEITRQISRIEGIDRDGTLAGLKGQLNEILPKIDNLEGESSALEREVSSLRAAINQTRAHYENERQKRDLASPDRSLLEKSERTRRVIEELVPELFPLKVRQLSASMTRVYKQLAHKSQVARVVIENDGTTKLMSANGKELQFDRSAGENQIFATALIAGLAEVSKIDAPLVVDTPLGRLDSKHRENIFDFWTSNDKRQVILLSQDEEIGASGYSKIMNNVSKTFLLKHAEVGDGIGRTTVEENKYFGEVGK